MYLYEDIYVKDLKITKKFPFSKQVLGKTPFSEASFVRNKMQRSMKQYQTQLKQHKQPMLRCPIKPFFASPPLKPCQFVKCHQFTRLFVEEERKSKIKMIGNIIQILCEVVKEMVK